jgi:CBS domain-containing protein
MGTRNIAIAEAGPRAADVMLDAPKTFPPSTTVAQARAVFESPKQKLLVVCDGPRFVGAIRRDGLDGADDPDAAVTDYLDASVPVLAPDDPSARVPDLCAESGLTRVPVVDEDGELLGLVCFNSSPASFCVR